MTVLRASALIAGAFLLVTCGTSFLHAQEPCPAPEPRWHSDAWWAMKAHEPVGDRQVDFHGKTWPPYPRPVGPPQACCHVYHATHYWPWPYVCTDRQVVLDMTRSQEANGWINETTLYDYHFQPETNELTVPGKAHLRWILDYTPANFRAVWVQPTDDPAVSQQRMTSIRNVAVRLVGEANLPPIAFRASMAPSRPANEIESIRRRELGSIPTPRIPFESGAGGASSTSTSGSGSGSSSGGGQAQ